MGHKARCPSPHSQGHRFIRARDCETCGLHFSSHLESQSVGGLAAVRDAPAGGTEPSLRTARAGASSGNRLCPRMVTLFLKIQSLSFPNVATYLPGLVFKILIKKKKNPHPRIWLRILEREEGGEKCRCERETSIGCFPYAPRPGISPAT